MKKISRIVIALIALVIVSGELSPLVAQGPHHHRRHHRHHHPRR